MLRRTNSHRPSRSKSTSSFQSRQEAIDPAEARVHAQTAAEIAFIRAQERSNNDHNRLSRSNDTTSYESRSQAGEQGTSMNHDNQGLKRRQSVRFVGPNAVNRRQSTGRRAQAAVITSKPSTATLRPLAMTTSAPVPAAYRPPSRSSSIGKASIGRAATQNYASTLAFDEYYTHEDELASTPSSFERHAGERAVRKSKSMFTPSGAPNVFYNNGSPDRLTSYSGTPRTQENEAPLRAPRSMSFLRGGSDFLKSATGRERNDEAVQMARDRFFAQATEQRLREQPSFLFRSKAQRQEKPFRKSVRSSSGKSGTTDSSESTKDFRLKDKARKVSQTLKNKLRKVFGRGKEEPINIPNQQMDAVETHVRAYAGQISPNHEEFIDIPIPDHAAFAHVTARVPSLRAIASKQQLRSQAGSVRSIHSDHSDDKSRVTSWTNNSTVNTISSQGVRTQQDRDQRLSIINETGTHITKASFHRPNTKTQFSAYPAFHRPGHVQPPRPGGVDSARVYSALMKRLDENNPKTLAQGSRNSSTDTLRADCEPRRSSSFKSFQSQQRPWIRHVPPESNLLYENPNRYSQERHAPNDPDTCPTTGEELFGRIPAHGHQFPADLPDRSQLRDSDDVFSSKPASSKGNPFGRRNGTDSTGRGYSLSEADLLYNPPPDPSGLTQQEIAARDDPVPSTKVIREARSAFFGGTTFRMDRTTSPYRRALAGNDHSAIPNDDSPSRRGSPTPNAPPSRTTAAAVASHDDSYSESIYSRTTGATGVYNSQAESCESFAPAVRFPSLPSDRASGSGAVIINSTTYRPTHPRQRSQSSAGSNEWKQWMSLEVAKLERPENGSKNALPSISNSYQSRHRREQAQMTDDDTDISQKKIPPVKQPLGLVQQNVPSTSQQLLKPILKNRSATSLVENNDPPNYIPPPPPIPPPIPARSPLRQVQSRTSLKSNSTVTLATPNAHSQEYNASTRNVLHKRNVSDARSIRSVKSSKSFDTISLSPAKLVKRTGRPIQYTTTPQSSPGGICAAVEKQFGSRDRSRGYNDQENVSTKEDVYGAEGSGVLGPVVVDAQQLGSKQMVDLFLSSRRRRMASGSEDSRNGMGEGQGRDGCGSMFL